MVDVFVVRTCSHMLLYINPINRVQEVQPDTLYESACGDLRGAWEQEKARKIPWNTNHIDVSPTDKSTSFSHLSSCDMFISEDWTLQTDLRFLVG